jgi:phage/conjugal plasmid C-4 type zinc finger TraR family protein
MIIPHLTDIGEGCSRRRYGNQCATDGIMDAWSALKELEMAGGWARDDAVQEQIDANVEDAVARARSNVPSGESRRRCAECDERIPEARRQALPGVRYCIACQTEFDRQLGARAGYNRRGSKDSQLR